MRRGMTQHRNTVICRVRFRLVSGGRKTSKRPLRWLFDKHSSNRHLAASRAADNVPFVPLGAHQRGSAEEPVDASQVPIGPEREHRAKGEVGA